MAETTTPVQWVTIPAAILAALMEETDALQRERAAFHQLILQQWKVLGELTAVCAELTTEKAHRDWLYQSHRKAEREAQRLTLPLWFWRRERPGRTPEDIQAMLGIRARFLAGECRVSLDDCWDLLVEFCRDGLKVEQDEDLLRRIIAAVYSPSREGGS
jgi:hypothetical protein